MTSKSTSASVWSEWINGFRQLERDIAQLKAFWDAPALDETSRDPAEALAPAQELFQQASSLCQGLEKTRRLAERMPTASSLTTTVSSMIQQNERFLQLIGRVLGTEQECWPAPLEADGTCGTPASSPCRTSAPETIGSSSPWSQVAPRTPNVGDLRLASSTLAQLKLDGNKSPRIPTTAEPAVRVNGDAFERLYQQHVSVFVQRQLSANELATWWQRLQDLLASGAEWRSATELLQIWDQDRTRLKLALLALTQMDLLATRWEDSECTYALHRAKDDQAASHAPSLTSTVRSM